MSTSRFSLEDIQPVSEDPDFETIERVPLMTANLHPLMEPRSQPAVPVPAASIPRQVASAAASAGAKPLRRPSREEKIQVQEANLREAPVLDTAIDDQRGIQALLKKLQPKGETRQSTFRLPPWLDDEVEGYIAEMKLKRIKVTREKIICKALIEFLGLTDPTL